MQKTESIAHHPSTLATEKSPRERFLDLAISLAPLVINWLFIGLVASGIYFWDEWDGIVDLSNTFRNNGLHLADFWAAHNEHRFFLPRFLFLASDLVFRDPRFLMFLNSIVCWLTLRELSIGLQMTRIFETPKWRWATYALMCFFFFSWIQTENLFWGFQLSWFMEAWAAVAAIRAFHLRHYKTIAICFLVAYLSHAAWVALAIVLGLLALLDFASAAKAEKRTSFAVLLAISTVSLLALVAYLPGLHRASTGPLQLQHFFKLVTYALTLIGVPFCGIGQPLGTLFGMIFLVCTAWLIRSCQLLTNRFASGLIAYTVISACVFALGRYQIWSYDLNVPFRYSTLLLPGWIALITVLLKEFRMRRSILIAIQLSLAITTVDIFLKYFDFERGVAQSRNKAGECLKRVIADNASSVADRQCALYLFPEESLFLQAKLWMRPPHYD